MLIEFYKEEDGTKPVLDYLMKCEKKVRAKLMRTIRLLELGGTSLRMPYSEYLREDVLELRTQVGNNRYRVLYFFCDGEKAILTNCFLKTTQKTPEKELEKAIRRKNRYYRLINRL